VWNEVSQLPGHVRVPRRLHEACVHATTSVALKQNFTATLDLPAHVGRCARQLPFSIIGHGVLAMMGAAGVAAAMTRGVDTRIDAVGNYAITAKATADRGIAGSDSGV